MPAVSYFAAMAQNYKLSLADARGLVAAAGGAGAKHTTGNIAGSGVESKFADCDSAAQALHSALNTEAGKFALTNLAKLKDGRVVLTAVSAAKPPGANTALKTSVPALKLSGNKHAPAIVSVLNNDKCMLKLAALYKTPDVAAFYKTPDLGALYKTPDAPAAAASKPQGKVSASKAAVLYFTSTAQDSVVASSDTTLAPLKSVTVTNPIAHKPWYGRRGRAARIPTTFVSLVGCYAV